MVQPEAFAGLLVLDHQIDESIHVARCLQHRFRCQNRALDLQHFLLLHEEHSPCFQDVVLQTASARSEIVQSGDASVDGETLVVEESAHHQVFELGAIESAGLYSVEHKKKTYNCNALINCESRIGEYDSYRRCQLQLSIFEDLFAQLQFGNGFLDIKLGGTVAFQFAHFVALHKMIAHHNT